MQLSAETAKYIIENGIKSGLILVGALVTRMIVAVLIRMFVKKLEDDQPDTRSAREQRTETLASLARNVANFSILSIAGLMILSEWDINITPILTGAGILGLAVGFGTQKLVSDIVAGFFLLMENQYNVGDRVNLVGQEGVVKEIKLRTTVLKGDDGKIYTIPNSNVSVITRLNKRTENSETHS